MKTETLYEALKSINEASIGTIKAKVAALSVSTLKPEIVRAALEKALLPIKRLMLAKPNLENAKAKLIEAQTSLAELVAYNPFNTKESDPVKNGLITSIKRNVAFITRKITESENEYSHINEYIKFVNFVERICDTPVIFRNKVTSCEVNLGAWSFSIKAKFSTDDEKELASYISTIGGMMSKDNSRKDYLITYFQ